MKFRLNKKNKLKLKSKITEIFQNKKSLQSLPLKLLYKKLNDNEVYKVAFFIPKKYIRLAVNRKRVKRLLVENFRLEYPKLQNSTKYNFIFIWESKKIPNFKEVQTLMKNIFNQL